MTLRHFLKSVSLVWVETGPGQHCTEDAQREGTVLRLRRPAPPRGPLRRGGLNNTPKGSTSPTGGLLRRKERDTSSHPEIP